MLAQQTILEAAQRAATAASSPARIMLFGSYARSDADEGSDLDLLVIEHCVIDKAAEYLKLHRAIGAIETIAVHTAAGAGILPRYPVSRCQSVIM